MDAEISRDSSRTLCVTKVNEREFWVKMYCLETLEMKFSEQITGTYVKCSQLSQNSTATKFALPYNDNGVFKFRSFGRDTRSEETI